MKKDFATPAAGLQHIREVSASVPADRCMYPHGPRFSKLMQQAKSPDEVWFHARCSSACGLSCPLWAAILDTVEE